MPQFLVDDDLAALVWELAEPKPFENLTFNVALRRALALIKKSRTGSPVVVPVKEAKRAATPDANDYLAKVPELQQKVQGRADWSKLCKAVGVEPKGDSARRKLRLWVEQNRPNWPPVPRVHP